MPCEVVPVKACGGCFRRLNFFEKSVERVVVAGGTATDSLRVDHYVWCPDASSCTHGLGVCVGDVGSTVPWAVPLLEYAGSEPPARATYSLSYPGIEGFEPGRYRGALVLESTIGCCYEDCAAVDLQVIDEVAGNHQPIARITATGAEHTR